MTQFHRIEGFYRAAIAGGYARAARDCPYPITAPAIHQQVRKLEAELGVRLLERVGKDVVRPTSHGRALFEFVEPFYRDWPSLERALAANMHTGSLRIEAANMELQYVIPKWISRIRTRSPELRISLEEVSVADPQRVMQGEADIVVDYLPQLPEGISAAHVATYYAFIVLPHRRPKPGEKRLSWKQAVEKLPFIGFPANLPQHAIQRKGLDHLGLPFSSDITASTVSAILALVSEGIGFSLLPWPNKSGPQVPGVSARPLLATNTEFQVVAAYKTRSVPDPWIEAALRALPR